MGNKKRSPLGTGDIHFSLTKEVITALNQITDESDQSESMSRFVDSWLRQHPQVKAKLTPKLTLEQQKGTEQS